MKFLTLIFLVINVAISSPLFAQTKDAEFPVDAQQTESTGPYIRETHGSWEVRCIKLSAVSYTHLTLPTKRIV